MRALEQVERLSILRRDTPEDWRHKVVQIMNRSKDRGQKTLINKKRRKHFIKMAGIVRRNKLRHGKIANILARHMQAELQGNWNDALPEEIQPELSEAERSELETRLDNLPDDLSAAIRHIGREAIIQNYGEHGYNIPDIAGEIELETFITDEDIQRFVDEEEEASMRAGEEYDEYLRLEEEQREKARREAEEDAQYEQYVEDQERQQHAAEQPDERDEIEQRRAEKARRFAQQADEARWEEERREEAQRRAEEEEQRRAEEEEQRRLEEEAQRDNEDTSAAEDSSVVDSAAEESFADHDYNLSEIPANLEYNARQLLNQLMMRDILIGRNFYPHADDDRQTQVNIDVPTFLQLAVRNVRNPGNNLRAGPRTLAAIELLKLHAHRDPILTAYLGETVLRDFRQQHPQSEIEPSNLVPYMRKSTRYIETPPKKPRKKPQYIETPPKKPAKKRVVDAEARKTTVLHYSDSDSFQPSHMKTVTPKKWETRAKKAKVDVDSRLQEIAQHNELLRREGIAAGERARQRIAALRGQNQTFGQAHAAQVATERARVMGPQLPPTHGFRLRR